MLAVQQLYYYGIAKLSPTRLVLVGAQSTPDQQAAFPRLLFVDPRTGDTLYAKPFPQLTIPHYFISFYQAAAEADGSFLTLGIGGDSVGGYLQLWHFDSTGTLQWQNRVRLEQGMGYLPENGGINVLPDGYLIQTYRIDPNPIGYGTLLKVDRRGNYQWHHTLGRWSQMGEGPAVPCPDGSYVVCAVSSSRFPLPHLIPWDYDNLLIRFRTDGTVVDSAYLGTRSCFDGVKHVSPTPDGGFLLTGFRVERPAPGQSRYYEGHVIKVDSDFHKQWEVRLPSALARYGWFLQNGQALANGHYRVIGYTALPTPPPAGSQVGAVVEIAPPAGTGPADTLGSVVTQWLHPGGLFLRVLPQADGSAYVAGTGINTSGNQRYYAKLDGLGTPAPAPDLCARPPVLGRPPTATPVGGRPDTLTFALDATATLAGPRYGQVARVEWDFGDNSPVVEGWVVGHRYASPQPVRARVCVTNNLWCRTCADLYPLGADAMGGAPVALSVYPNPSASGAFTLRTEAAAGGRYVVVDATGRVVAAGVLAADGPTRLDLGGQAAGVYALRVRWPDGRAATRRLVRW